MCQDDFRHTAVYEKKKIVMNCGTQRVRFITINGEGEVLSSIIFYQRNRGRRFDFLS